MLPSPFSQPFPRLLLFGLLSLISTHSLAQEGAVVVLAEGRVEACTFEELGRLARQTPGPERAVWRWAKGAPPQRFDDAKAALQPLEEPRVMLEVQVLARAEERPPAAMIAAPEAMWREVPEALLPQWTVVWPEKGQKGPGRARIPTTGSGRWRVRAVAKDLGSSWREIPEGLESLTVHLVAARNLQVRLQQGTAESVQPVAGARIAVIAGGHHQADAQRLTHGISDDQGEMRLAALPQGEAVTLVVEATGFAPRVLMGSAQQLSGNLLLRPAVGIAGRVVDRDGESVAGITVEAATWIDPELPELLRREAKSDIEGRWRIGDLPAGKVAVGIVTPGYAVDRQTVEVREGIVQVGDLVLRPDRGITVVVTDELENPVAGATVRAEQEEFSTDRQGRVTLTGLPGHGVLRLFAEAPGYVRGMKAVPLPTLEAVHIALERAFTVTGRIVDPRGLPVEEGRASGRISIGNRSQGAGTELTAGGDFRLELPPRGKGTVTLSTPQYLELQVPVVTGEPGGSLDLGDLTLTTGTQVVGRVVDGRDGTPLPGARIWAPKGDPSMALQNWLRGRLYTAISDAEGRFDLTGIAPGALLDLRIDRSGFARLSVEAQTTEEDPLVDLGDLHLSQGATVEVRFEGDGGSGTARLDLRGEGLELDQLAAPLRDGIAVAEHVPAGAVEVKVVAGTEALCAASAVVPASGSVVVPCRRAGVRVEGWVRVAERTSGAGMLGWTPPVSGPRVLRTRSGPGGLQHQQSFGGGGQPLAVAVDRDGRFVIESMKPGTWEVAWGPEGGGDAYQSVKVEIPEVEVHTLTLDFGGGIILGTVTDADGAPVGATVVTLQGGSSTRTGGDGTFALPVPGPGQYRVQARREEASLYSEAVAVEIIPGETPPPIALTLASRPREIVVSVLEPGGAPAVGALVFLEVPGGGLRLATTDASGEIRRTLTPPLPERLRAATNVGGAWVLGGWQTLEEAEAGLRLQASEAGSVVVIAPDEERAGFLDIVGPEGWDVDGLLLRMGVRPRIVQGQPTRITGLPVGTYLFSLGSLPVQVAVQPGRETEVSLE